MRLFTALGLLMLAGCGVADVATTAASTAELQAQQAKQGKEITDKIKSDLDAAAKTEQQQKANADAVY